MESEEGSLMDMSDEPTCALCGRPTIEHAPGACEAKDDARAVQLYDLPIFAWAWREDARDTERY